MLAVTGKPHPRLDIEIGLRIGDIIDNEHSRRALVVDLAQRLILLLPGRIPKCDLDILVVRLDNLGQELDTYCSLLSLVELIADVAGGDIGLTRATAADDNNLEHLVIIVHYYSLFYIRRFDKIYIYMPSAQAQLYIYYHFISDTIANLRPLYLRGWPLRNAKFIDGLACLSGRLGILGRITIF